MNNVTHMEGRPIIGGDDQYLTVTVPANAGDNLTTPPATVLSFRTPLSRRCWIRALGNVAGPGGDAALTFRLKVNRSPIYPYDGSQNQWGDPGLLQDLPIWVAVPAGALIEVEVSNSDGDNSFSATARVWTAYTNV